MAIDQAQLLLKGNPGTTVQLSVIRRGKAEPQEMNITLAKLAAPKLVEDRLNGDVAYLRVPEFTPGVSKQIREKLVQFQKAGAKKLLLDLRDCSLGDDQEGIQTAQLFLTSGTIATLKGPDGHRGRFFRRSDESSLDRTRRRADRQRHCRTSGDSGGGYRGQQARQHRR